MRDFKDSRTPKPRSSKGRWKPPEKKLGVTKALRRDTGKDLQGCQRSMWLDWWLGV